MTTVSNSRPLAAWSVRPTTCVGAGATASSSLRTTVSRNSPRPPPPEGDQRGHVLGAPIAGLVRAMAADLPRQRLEELADRRPGRPPAREPLEKRGQPGTSSRGLRQRRGDPPAGGAGAERGE